MVITYANQTVKDWEQFKRAIRAGKDSDAKLDASRKGRETQVMPVSPTPVLPKGKSRNSQHRFYPRPSCLYVNAGYSEVK